MSGPYILSESTHGDVRGVAWQAAVLPFGATEPHNYHLPYGTDVYQIDALARRACALAWDAGAKVLCLPAIPFGVNTSQLDTPGGYALSIMPSTQLAIVRDVVDSLARQGIRKLLLLNGHGANELKPIARELYGRGGVFCCLANLWTIARDARKGLIENRGDHADEFETSLMLHLHPDWVKMDAAGDGAVSPSRFAAVEQGWVTIVRPWHLLTADTGVGDPHKATAGKGKACMDAMAKDLGEFLAELARSTMDERFPMT